MLALKKKSIQLFVCFISTLLIRPAFSQIWSDPILITQGSTPDFTIDPNSGRLHIITMINGATYTVTDYEGNILSSYVVPGSDLDIGLQHRGATIDIDSQGYPHVVYRNLVEGTSYWYDIYYTFQSGTGWSEPILLDENIQRGYVVRIAVDGFDHVHILRSEAHPVLGVPYGQVQYYQIQNGSVVMDRLFTNPDPVNYRVDNRFEIDAEPDGQVHVILGCVSRYDGPVTYHHSSDGGSTFTIVEDIHDEDCPNRNGDPDVFVDTEGNIHFIYGTNVDTSVTGLPSVRYSRYESGVRIRDVRVTDNGELPVYRGGNGWGEGSVASTEDGQIICVAYILKPYEDLFTRLSTDGGITWSEPTYIDSTVGTHEGRNLHLLRANGNHFYLVYPNPTGVKLRILSAVDNPAPSAVAGGPYTGQEGEPIRLDMSSSFDQGENAGIVQYAWNWGGVGVYDLITEDSVVYHTFDDDLSGESVLRVKDRSGIYDKDSTLITITNVPPSVNVGVDKEGYPNEVISFSCSIEDPGADEHSIEWDFGDLHSDTLQNVTHAYSSIGYYTVRATVTDDDGGVGSDSLTVRITNDPIVHSLERVGGQGLQLSWNSVDGATAYRIYRDTTAYFEPDIVGGNNRIGDQIADEDPSTPGIQWTDTSVGIGDPETNYFYAVTATGTGGESDPSNRVGVFHYSLQTTATTDFNTIALPLQHFTSPPFKASDVISMLPACNSVAYWDPDLQGYHQYITTIPSSDFSLTDGTPLFVNMTADTVFTLIGKVVDIDYQLVATSGTSFNNIMLPLNKTSLTSASALMSDIPGCNSVARWNPAIQGYEQYVTGLPLLDFEIRPGYPYLVNVISDVAWPSVAQTSRRSKTIRNVKASRVSIVPHIVWGSIKSETLASTISSIKAFILSRPEDILSEKSPGCFLGRDRWAVQCGSFITPWKAGETLRVIFHSESTDIVRDVPLSTHPADEVEAVSTIEPPMRPADFALDQNYPNPFNASTRIRFQLPRVEKITLTVHNCIGQRIACLLDERCPAGHHEIQWLPEDLPSGIYWLRLQAEDHTSVRKCILMR